MQGARQEIDYPSVVQMELLWGKHMSRALSSIKRGESGQR